MRRTGPRVVKSMSSSFNSSCVKKPSLLRRIPDGPSLVGHLKLEVCLPGLIAQPIVPLGNLVDDLEWKVDLFEAGVQRADDEISLDHGCLVQRVMLKPPLPRG